MQLDIRAALDAFRDDDSVAVVVFTGAGEKAFVAGADIAQVRSYTLHTALSSDLQRLYDDVEAFEKPTIAAVNGFALGGGCELAMSCDIRIAADTARFGLPETNLSVLPAAGGTQRLARLVGTGRAIEMILTGRLVDAAEARADRPGHLRGARRRTAGQGPGDRRADHGQGTARGAARQAGDPVRDGRRPTHRPGRRTPRPGPALHHRRQEPRAPTRSWPNADPSSRGNDHVRHHTDPARPWHRSIRHIVVVGAGAMGSQIGMLCALAGYSRHHHRYRRPTRSTGRKHQLRQRMTRDVEKGRRSRRRGRRRVRAAGVQHRPDRRGRAPPTTSSRRPSRSST